MTNVNTKAGSVALVLAVGLVVTGAVVVGGRKVYLARQEPKTVTVKDIKTAHPAARECPTPILVVPSAGRDRIGTPTFKVSYPGRHSWVLAPGGDVGGVVVAVERYRAETGATVVSVGDAVVPVDAPEVGRLVRELTARGFRVDVVEP